MWKFLITAVLLAVVTAGAILAGQQMQAGPQATQMTEMSCSYRSGLAQVEACTTLIEGSADREDLDDETLATYYLNRANGHASIRDYDSALADYDEAIRYYPDEFLNYYNRARVFRLIGDYDAALKDHARAIAQDEEEPAAYTQRAQTLYLAKRYEESLPDLETALEMEPHNAATLNSMAWTLVTLKRAEDALPYSERALENDNEEASGSLDTYAHILAELGRSDEAVDYFEKAARVGGNGYVRQIQNALIHHGLLDAVPTGVFDLATREAVRACAQSNCRLLIGIDVEMAEQ
ncbi:tetratricopeptide repeat protein [Pyruvatibacter mobilis]|uniref:tetratricopeptide repeat protein n=1 Tax=Pyruvatibacter mobilis TaxID=1712261 RepID=UPI003D0E8122